MATIKHPVADVPPQAVRGDHMKIQYVTSLSSATNPKPKGNHVLFCHGQSGGINFKENQL